MQNGRIAPAASKLSLHLLFALLAGGVTAFGFGPYDFPPALIVGLAFFLRQIEAASPKRAFTLGIAFGLGQFSIGFSWLFPSIFDYGHFGLLGSVAILAAIDLEVALFIACFAWVIAQIPKHLIRDYIAAPTLWVLLEWLRQVTFGWGWNLLGYTWASWLPFAQAGAIVGVYGLSGMTLLLAAFVNRSLLPLNRVGVLCTITLLALLGTIGLLRLENSRENSSGNTLSIWAVQTNIPQDKKWNPEYRNAILSELQTLTENSDGKNLIVWPESALPDYSNENLSVKLLLSQVSSKHPLLAGADIRVLNPEKELKYYNGALLMEHGELIGQYAKHQLIAFGEYLPFRNLLPATIQQFSPWPVDISPGQGPVSLDFGKNRIGVLICFEVIYPEIAAYYAANGANLLVNITNMAWFSSAAQSQILAMAQLRSIETGVPLAIVSNTGPTAMIDGKGRIIDHIDTGKSMARRFIVPDKEKTIGPYISQRMMILLTAGLFFTSLLILVYRKHHRKH